ncbi:hypothetical protein LCGC14_2620640 [marine sediment metagenome]|uniref:Uncharacterized protein n=1 Tax=marine sediment metagenome TaxID=412755 RepID=A0A0F9AQR3_9ZZZZ
MWGKEPKTFNEIHRNKAHPEKEINENIETLRELQLTIHTNLTKQNSQLDKKIDKLNKKVDVLLDLKILKQKIDKLTNI